MTVNYYHVIVLGVWLTVIMGTLAKKLCILFAAKHSNKGKREKEGEEGGREWDWERGSKRERESEREREKEREKERETQRADIFLSFLLLSLYT